MIMVVIKGMMGALFMENKRLSIRLICDLLFMIFSLFFKKIKFYFFKIFFKKIIKSAIMLKRIKTKIKRNKKQNAAKTTKDSTSLDEGHLANNRFATTKTSNFLSF